jgi:hypothetical protein
MQTALSTKETVWSLLLGEPFAWLIVGLGLLIGHVSESIAALLIFWGVTGCVWYLTRLRKSDFLCPKCGKQWSYRQAREAALHA